MNTIAIVGRPNVGKSTLFNRLTESNKAITQKTPGVTRDRQYGTCMWQGHNFAVIDTGGYSKDSGDSFEREIKNQIDIALEDSSAIFFVVDTRQGITRHDQELAQILRKSSKKVFLIANKTDSLELSLASSEFYNLGFKNVYQIAAINGYGTGDLLDKVIEHIGCKNTPKKTSPVAYLHDSLAVNNGNQNIESHTITATSTLQEQQPADNIVTLTDSNDDSSIKQLDRDTHELPKISIVGKPNVGKSSLVNLLIGNNRAIVTPIPGTTRDTTDSLYNLYGKKFVITDTAGLRKKSKVHDDIEFYSKVRSVKAIQKSDVCIVMVCAQEGVTAQDMHIIATIQRYKKGMVLVVNKWDLIAKDHNTMKYAKEDIIKKLGSYGHIPIIFTSVLDKARIHKAIDLALKVYKKKYSKISTSNLNELIQSLVAKYPPPAYRGKDIKLKYATQLPTKNLAIALFSNFPQHIKQNYKSYLEKHIRIHFKLQGIPIDIFFRKS